MRLNQNICSMLINCIMVLWLFVLINIKYISAETCGTNGEHWSTTFINSGVNPSIVGASTPSDSVLRCSMQCSPQYESFYYSSALKMCYCNAQLDESVTTTTADTDLIYGIKEKPSQKDCLDLYQKGYRKDGVYEIYPVSGTPVEAWCDMTGGGWTVIQRRQDGSENFNRTWNDYVHGFGDKTGEYWLGLENMRLLTTEASTLKVELESFGDVNPKSALAEYSGFAIGSPESNYRLNVSGFSGSCGDSLNYHNGMAFSTNDRDNDLSSGNCVGSSNGPWWYKSCCASHLNGMYVYLGATSSVKGIVWGTCWGSYSAKTSVMKIRRNI